MRSNNLNIFAFIPKFISASGDIATKVGTASSAIQAFSVETGIAAASLGSFAIAAAGVLAITAAVGIGIYAYERHLDNLRDAADGASAAVKNMQTDTASQLQKVGELKKQLDSGNLSLSEAATVRGEIVGIQSELIKNYGLEARYLDMLSDSLDVTSSKMDRVLGREARKAIDENLDAYEEAAKKIQKGNDTYLSIKGANANIADYASALVEAYDNVSFANNAASLKISGDAYEVQQTLNDIYNNALDLDTSEFSDKQLKVFDVFKSGIRSGLAGVEKVISEYGGRYQDYLLNQILADDDARHLMSRVSDYVEDLNNAIAEGDFTAANAAIQSLFTLQNVDLHGAHISEELKNYIAQIINEAINGAPAEATGNGIKGEDWWMRYYGNGMEQGAEETAQSIKQSFDSLFADSEGKETDFSKAIDNYISDVTDLQEALSKLDSGTLSDSDKFKLFKDFPQLAAGSDDLKSAIESLLDSMDSDIADEFDRQLESLSEQDQTKLLSMKDAILGIGNASESSAVRLSSFKDGLDLVQTAIGESTSGLGMTTESINALIARYEKLEGFDMADLFTKTANGIRLNKDAFEDLERAYTSSQQADIANDLADAQQRYADLTSQIDLCRDAQERIGLYAQRSAVLDEINDLELLQAEYDGLTSAYNRWVFAQNSANENDSYAAIAGALEGYKESIDDGWITAETRAFIDLISAQDLSTAKLEDVYAAWEGFHKNIEGSGGYSITDFFRWDDDKNLTTEGLENFVKALHNTLGDEFAKYEDGKWKIDLSGDKASMVESAMGISEEFQEILVSALGEAGDFEISLGTIFGNTDLASTYVEKAGQRINALRSQWGYEPIEMAFDSTDIETVESNLVAVQEHLAAITSEEYRPYVNDSDIVDAEAAALMLSQQLTELENQEFLAGFDTTHITQDGQELLDTITNLRSMTSELDLKIGMDLPTGDLQEKVSSELSSLQSFMENMGITLDIPVNATNTQTLDAIINAMANMTDEQRSVFVEVTGLTDIQNVKAAEDTVEDKSIDVTANTMQAESALNTIINTLKKVQSKTITVTTNYVSNGKAGGGTGGEGVVNGTAHAGGTWGTRKTEDALMGELGPEIIVDPNSGTWHTVGDYGAEIVKVPKGSIIFNHQQTEDILKHGWVVGRGHAYAGGTAYAATAFGGFLKRKATGSNDYTITKKSSSSSKKSSTSSSTTKKSSSSKSSSASSDLETLDWIEIALERIEQEIETLDQIADSAYKNLSNRLEATGKEIGMVTDEIEIQKAAYDRYMQQANSVGLSDDLAELVRNGAIDIVDYSKDTQELIKDYQEWYEKAIDCSKAIDDLHESLADLYTDGFSAIKDDYEAQLELLEHLTNTYDNHIEQLEAKGYMASIAYQRALQNVEAQNKQILEAELEDLIQTYSDAMNSGEIEEGSEAWYEMNQEINAVKEAIDDCNLSMLEIGNTIREIQWDRFDYLQDLISEITEEADFLIDLMSNSDLLNGSGGLTSEGMATLGLRAQNFNTYMSQADKYAAEILSLDKEIANDPYNTDLIERRQELLELQRKSILAAEDEKQAMADLVHDGIEEQLSALKDLIDAYEDSLDSAKDYENSPPYYESIWCISLNCWETLRVA